MCIVYYTTLWLLVLKKLNQTPSLKETSLGWKTIIFWRMAGAGIVHNIPILMEGASYAEALMITIIIGVICGPQKNMQQTQLSALKTTLL